jgi:hypothetical protein
MPVSSGGKTRRRTKKRWTGRTLKANVPDRPRQRKTGAWGAGGLDSRLPLARPLKAYGFDPSLLGSEMSLAIRYQELDKGPVVRDPSAQNGIAIVDYAGATRTWYKPVDLDDPHILIRGGLDPSESDPQFHQQMVYAVVTETIQHFEAALARRIHWRRAERIAGRPIPGDEDIFTLNIFPHAMVSPNAFYSPKAHGILFGYFRADLEDPGRNLPGQIVYTCLSHDVVVHETTHAIIDGLRRYFTEQTNPDVPAFHEAFADIAGLFMHFTHREVLLDTIQRTGGTLYRYHLQPDAVGEPEGGVEAKGDGSERAGEGEGGFLTAQVSRRNPLVELAQQFGEARGMNRGLRSALGTDPRPGELGKLFEPHTRGSILVAAIFDAYFSIYLQRTSDLFRIYRSGGASATKTDVPSSLAGLLANEAARMADLFFTLCVRALDYCPPVDISFGDFLRAVITADFDLHPEDTLGLRDAFMQAFRRRGIFPEGACFFSEAGIAWPRAGCLRLDPVLGLDFGGPNGLTDAQKRTNKRALLAYVENASSKQKLGLDRDPKLPIEIPSFHPVFRVNPDGSLRTDMVVEMLQRLDVQFDPREQSLGTFPMRGGATLIISKPTVEELRRDPRGGATVRYVIGKQLRGAQGQGREERQRRYCQRIGLVEGSDPGRFQINFSMVHGGV